MAVVIGTSTSTMAQEIPTEDQVFVIEGVETTFYARPICEDTAKYPGQWKQWEDTFNLEAPVRSGRLPDPFGRIWDYRIYRVSDGLVIAGVSLDRKQVCFIATSRHLGKGL